MLEQICGYIHNYFVHSVTHGVFTIRNGTLSLTDIANGQYIAIRGSRMNDGVYQYPPYGLTDETFEGAIWDMRPPRGFLTLAGEIEAWQDKYGDATSGPYQSESFGGYSYTLATTQGANGNTLTGWQNTFKARLDHWRKLA